MLLTANESPKMGIYYIPVRAQQVFVFELVVLTALGLCVALLHCRFTVDTVCSVAQ